VNPDDLLAMYDRVLDPAGLICDRPEDARSTALLFDTGTAFEPLSYGELARASRNLACTLQEAGVRKGDHVAVLLPRSPVLVIALLAVWRCGAIYVPLFTALGPATIDYRISHCRARAVITDDENRSKVSISPGSPVAVGTVGHPWPGDFDVNTAIERDASVERAAYAASDAIMMLYTSGTTGKPKGVPVPTRALASIHSYLLHGIALRDSDVYWNVGDPGWAYGLWYGIIGPLLLHHCFLVRQGLFDPLGTIQTLVRANVTNVAGSPSLFRALQAYGVPPDLRESLRLRAASSAGEPLGADVMQWSADQLGVEIHDHYGQTEVGMVIGVDRDPSARRPPRGSMGANLPGFTAVVLDESGRRVPTNTAGILALDVPASPLLWFGGYHLAPDKTAERYPFGARYYVTGDTAMSDEHGDLTSGGRADDVINSSGYRIGPSDVEEALRKHPAVSDVAVYGVPDMLRGEIVAAAVVPVASVEIGSDLIKELQDLVRSTLGTYLYPREVTFVETLPRTESGKVQRAVLRQEFTDRR
jgi:acetyl-CoA synthetase